jgi:hypothetical protein
MSLSAIEWKKRPQHAGCLLRARLLSRSGSEIDRDDFAVEADVLVFADVDRRAIECPPVDPHAVDLHAI